MPDEPAMEKTKTERNDKMSSRNVQEIEVGMLAASPTNPRKKFSGLEEMAATMREHGVLEPLLVRKHDGEFVYEIIAGERRWRAAQLAGLSHVPCVVKELNEQQVTEIQWIENLQRQDLTAVEEGEGFARLIQSGAWTVESLAERFARSRSHIFGRLKLARLTGPAREALESGKIPFTIAELVAKVAPGWQGKFLEEVLKGYGGGEPLSFRQAKYLMERDFVGQLDYVRWDIKDRKLHPDAGCCAKCPKRSGNLTGEEAEAFKNNPNVCTDLDCFHEKVGRHRRAVLKGLKGGKNTTVMTLEEGDKELSRWNGFDNKSEYENPKRFHFTRKGGDWATFAQAVKNPTGALYLFVDRQGDVLQGRKKSEMKAELKKLGLWTADDVGEEDEGPDEGESAEEFKARQAKAKEELEKAREKERIRQLVRVKTTCIAAETLIGKLGGPELKGKSEEQFWRLLLKGVSRMTDSIDEGVFKRFAIKGHEWGEVPKGSEKWSVATMRRYVLEVLLSEESYNETDAPYHAEDVEYGCKLVGIDLKKIAKGVEKEVLEPEAKAAAAETKSVKGKKGGRK